MFQWLSRAEHAEIEGRLEAARQHWIGQTLDYGAFERTVFDVDWDLAKGRLILLARGEDEDGYVPELASKWEEKP